MTHLRSTNISARILASFLLLFSVLFMPFWVSAVLALAGMAYFNIFWEAPFLLLLSDLLFGIKEAKFDNMIFISFIVTTTTLVIIEAIKKKLKFYK